MVLFHKTPTGLYFERIRSAGVVSDVSCSLYCMSFANFKEFWVLNLWETPAAGGRVETKSGNFLVSFLWCECFLFPYPLKRHLGDDGAS